MESAVPSKPKRKEKTTLTLIPEQERQISYRFDICLVGQSASSFAQKLVNSDAAEAYAPRQKKETKKLELLREDEESAGAVGARNEQQKSKDDKFALFVPIGDVSVKKELARVRFIPLERFSESIPLKSDPQLILNTGVAFLLWKVSKTRDEEGKDPCESAIHDWISRLAEIKHGSKARQPYQSVLAFKVDAQQEELLDRFAGNPMAKQVRIEKFSNDDEDSAMDALTCMCESMIEYQVDAIKNAESTPTIVGVAPDSGPTARANTSRFCTVL